MFTSYAQNFEDVMLWRALGHVQGGLYIDIGAQDPLIDSVSLAFHERGWKGIHVEPVPRYAELLRQQRPYDIVIQAAIGEEPAIQRFYEYSCGGLSTSDPGIAALHRERGFQFGEIFVACMPLIDIFKLCAKRDIHWMKVDVEGAEGQVLASWGNSAERPWVVVIESTFPNSRIESHEEWEELLISRGYSCVYFDGLNRYYVSDQHLELTKAFGAPPNIFDDFALNGTASAPFHKLIEVRFSAQIDQMRLLGEHERDSAKAEIDRMNSVLASRDAENAMQEKQLRDELDNSLKALAQRERDLSALLLEARGESVRIQRESVERERDLAALMSVARDESQQTQQLLMQREQAFAAQLVSLQQRAAQERAEQAHRQDVRELALIQQSQVAQRELLIALEIEFKSQISAEQQTSIDVRQTLAEVKAHLASVQASLFWRVTAPFRGLTSALNRSRERSDSMSSGSESKLLLASGEQSKSANHVPQTPIMNPTKFPSQANSPLIAGSIDELLAHHNEGFVVSAYHTLLGRDPDPLGMAYYLKKLHTGSPKIRIIKQICTSPEGRSKKIALPGLARAMGGAWSRALSMDKIPYADLARFNGEEFIENCYLRLLHRQADPSGRAYFLSKVEAGEDKGIIIGGILRSEEGRRVGERVSGLWMRYVLKRLERLPVLGSRIAAQSNDVGRSLRAIDNQLHRLIEVSTAPRANDPVVLRSQPQPVLAITPAPQFELFQPAIALALAKPNRPSIFLAVNSDASLAAEMSCVVSRVGSTFLEQGVSILFVRWSADTRNYQLVTKNDLDRLGLAASLGEFVGSYPIDGKIQIVIESSSCGKDDWLLVPEIVRIASDKPSLVEMDMILEAKRLGLRSAFIFHGAEPLRLKKHAGSDAEAHERYMQALLLADVIMPVSSLAATDLKDFFVQYQKADSGPLIKEVPLPAEVQDGTANRWSNYVRCVRGVLTDAASTSSHLLVIYYWIDLAASPDTEQWVFAGRLACALTDCGIALVPVVWDAEDKQLISAKGKYLDQWAHANVPGSWAEWIEPGQADAPLWLLHPGGVRGDLLAEVTVFVKSRGLRTATILPDAVNHPIDGDFAASLVHDQLLFEALAGMDKVMAISERRFRRFYRFLLSWRGKVHSAEHRFKTVALPNEIPGQRRRVTPKSSASDGVRILVVVPAYGSSDLSVMLDAVTAAVKRSPEQLIFTLIGVPSNISASQFVMLRTKISSIPGARWENEAGGEHLDQLFEVADFAIFTGFEGAGAQTVMESLWRGLPCLVHGAGPIPPSVPGSGLAFADLENKNELTEAILTLTAQDWRRYLAHEAISRPVRSWSDYAREIANELATDRLTDSLHRVETQVGRDVYATLVNLRRRPKLSLCISTYNRAGWVEINLRNIFTQIGKPRDDLEILVVDNTSVDHTPEVVKPYLSRSDFRYFRNSKNVGMLGNLAVTAQRAKGEYVWILGDDDLTRPGVIERVLQIINQHIGIGLIYLNYGYSSEADPGNIADLKSFLASYNTLEPAGPDVFASVKQLSAKCENFFTAIYSHVYRRDHALKSYCQNTSGRIFATMLSCVPTAYYVLNYMAEERAYWVGEPSLVVNSNVSWQDYGVLLDLEQLPRTWDLAERMGTDSDEVDRRRANRLWLVEMMWKEIFENDRAGNSAYCSAPRILMRLKHLKELDKHIPEFISVYERAYNAGHPAAKMPVGELFSAFNSSLH